MSRIPAQDEAVYAHQAMRMAGSGEWLTPVYLGRYALNKPPLLQWLAAASVRFWGASAWSVRVPSLAAAAIVALLIFILAWRTYSIGAAVFAVVLLTTNHLFIVFSRLCMTDMLLTCATVAAMFVLVRDPGLDGRWSAAAFGAFAGTAVMAKGAAGFLPLIALVVCAGLGLPRRRAVLVAFGTAALVALPWHVYQLAVHPRWFVAEYVLTQHLSVGVTAPPQYSNENHLEFYARRLFRTDPVLTAAALCALIPLWRRRRERRVLLVWGAVTFAALLGFRYRSAYYLLLLLPAMAIAAGEVYSALPARGRVVLLALLGFGVGLKAASPSATWGIPGPEGPKATHARDLEQYCGMRRGRELILIGSDDQFYASDLPLARVRYCLMGPAQPSRLDFAWLGISVSRAQFDHIQEWRPVLRKRLAAYGLPSDEAVATVIRAESAADVDALIERHPESDFYVPGRMLRKLQLKSAAHHVVPEGAGMLLLAGGDDRQRSRPCRLGPAQ